MGVEHMRGSYGRCPSFLFGGLILVCLIITVHWWSLSTQNNDLIRQLEDLGEKFKLSYDQREQCVQLRMILDNRLKNTEEELAQVKVRLEKMKVEINNLKTIESQKEEELKSLSKTVGDAEKSASMCGSELESLKKLDISKDATIASLRIEKDKYSSKIDEKDKEITRLKAEFENVKKELVVLKTDMQSPKTSIGAGDQVKGSQSKKEPSVEVRVKAQEGIIHRKGLVLVFDPPNAPRPSPRFSVAYLKGNQGGEPDDNHAGERGDGEEVPALPGKKSSSQIGKKASTSKNDGAPAVDSEPNIFNGNGRGLDGDDVLNSMGENAQVKPPESPSKLSS